MQKCNAAIERNEERVNLILTTRLSKQKICLTDDNPNEIKEVFNNLILELKNGKFTFNLSDETHDLFYQICNEYINQLNGEIADVYSQLKKYNLIECTEEI